MPEALRNPVCDGLSKGGGKGGKARYIDFQWRKIDCGGDPKRVRDMASVGKTIEIRLMFYCIHSCNAKHLVRVQAV